MPHPHMSQNQKREINGKRRNSQKELRMFPNSDRRSLQTLIPRLKPGIEVIKLEFILKLKIKRNDWLLVVTCWISFAPVFSFILLLSPYLCFISLLYFDLYVLGDDALIS